MKARISLTRVLFSPIVLCGLLTFLVGVQPAVAQGPDVGVPDATGPDLTGENQQSGRFVNVVQGQEALGQIDSGNLNDVDYKLRRHFSVRVPSGLGAFTLWFFDGNTRPASGQPVWDQCQGAGCTSLMNQMTYRVYRDPSGPIALSDVPSTSASPPDPFDQAPPANTDPLDLIATFEGEFMPEDQWMSFPMTQDLGACGSRRVGDGTVVANDLCGYHVVAEWVPHAAAPFIHSDQHSNFKVAVGAPGAEIFVFDLSNLGYIAYNFGARAQFPGPTSYDGTFMFNLKLDLAVSPGPGDIFTFLFDGDFDARDDGDDFNTTGFGPFPFPTNAQLEGDHAGEDPDDLCDPAQQPPGACRFTTWSPNVFYELTAPWGYLDRDQSHSIRQSRVGSFSIGHS